jgi:hypothetical protein
MEEEEKMTQVPWVVYAMAITCVSPCDGAGRMVRGQETMSMPSASDAFMSLTWIESSQCEYRGSPAQRTGHSVLRSIPQVLQAH